MFNLNSWESPRYAWPGIRPGASERGNFCINTDRLTPFHLPLAVPMSAKGHVRSSVRLEPSRVSASPKTVSLANPKSDVLESSSAHFKAQSDGISHSEPLVFLRSQMALLRPVIRDGVLNAQATGRNCTVFSIPCAHNDYLPVCSRRELPMCGNRSASR
jgi:hypothetical protein